MALALFDLDRTLLSVNAVQLWVRAERRRGAIGGVQAARAAVWIASYHLGFGNVERVLEDAIATLRGESEAEFDARTIAFYAAEVASTYRRRAREVVDRHRARGDTLALLTSSSIYLARIAQAELGIPHALCNRFEVVDGVFTGKPIRPLCFGAGKLTHAEMLAETLGEDLAEASFYTDSASDEAVLKAVANPVAVHPDPRLLRMAKKYGWKVEDWD
jgi:HAD superfamily hydrolase (TIGR01490 family)